MQLPTLSVVLPNYNHAKYLREALTSLLEQSVQPIEIIVIDDASTDSSVAVIKEFQAKHPVIKFIQNERNMGVVAGMNRVLDLVRGEFVYFSAADDKVLPGLFEKSLQMHSKYKYAPICFCDTASFDHETGRISYNALNLSATPAFFSPAQLVEASRHRRLLITGMSTMKVSTLKEMGGFLPELKWHCDYFYLFATAFRYGACYIPEALNLWRATPGSYMSAGLKRRQEQRAVIECALDLLRSDANKDVCPRFRDSGVLSLMPGILSAVWGQGKYREFRNFILIKRALPAEIFWRLPHPLQRIFRGIRASFG